MFFVLRLLFFVSLFFFPFAVCSQSETSHEARILFYNVENLFNPEVQEGKDDQAFTPEGDRRWTHSRKIQKQRNIARVILFAGKWNPPVLVGMCEVEGRDVLDGLIFNTGLDQLGYHAQHFESPDERGIDAALLYRRERFHVLESRPVPVRFDDPELRPTRDILYVKGVLDERDTLHVMVNHWPSRWGGELATRKKRMAAARVLNALNDSVQSTSADAKIIAMGDFNDGPSDPSLQHLTAPSGREDSISWVNLATYPKGAAPGTIRYRHNWECFDQILASRSLLDPKQNGYFLRDSCMTIVAPDFLLEDAPDYPGVRPRRTYSGYKYVGGFSDHLPVMVKLITKN